MVCVSWHKSSSSFVLSATTGQSLRIPERSSFLEISFDLIRTRKLRTRYGTGQISFSGNGAPSCMRIDCETDILASRRLHQQVRKAVMGMKARPSYPIIVTRTHMMDLGTYVERCPRRIISCQNIPHSYTIYDDIFITIHAFMLIHTNLILASHAAFSVRFLAFIVASKKIKKKLYSSNGTYYIAARNHTIQR